MRSSTNLSIVREFNKRSVHAPRADNVFPQRVGLSWFQSGTHPPWLASGRLCFSFQVRRATISARRSIGLTTLRSQFARSRLASTLPHSTYILSFMRLPVKMLPPHWSTAPGSSILSRCAGAQSGRRDLADFGAPGVPSSGHVGCPPRWCFTRYWLASHLLCESVS